MATPSIQWTGVDDSARQRKTGWYVVWILLFVLLATGAFALQWFLGYWQFWSVLILAMVMFTTLIVSNRSSQTIHYSLSKQNITINNKTYPISDFKYFTVDNSNGVWILHLIPVKKIAMEYDIIVPTENAEKIVDVFSKLLPMEDSTNTFSDKLASVLKL